MIGIDTNVLVRYLAQDDERQSSLASQIIEALTAEEPGFITTVVLVETVWVLTRAYKMSRPQIADVITLLLQSRELVIEHADAVHLAHATFERTAADFADALIAHGARLAGCRETVTFDRAAAADTGMRLLKA